MKNYEEYAALVNEIVNKYGLLADSEHQYIHEFYDGEFPIFKLILGQPNPKKDPMILISFHLDLPTPSAIEWFLRVDSSYPDLRITECYLKDQDGNSCVGEDADVLKMYHLEQEIIGAFLDSQKTDEEIMEPVKVAQAPKIESFSKKNMDEAINYFNNLTKKKGDTFH